MPLITGTANPEILTGTLAGDTVLALAGDDVVYGFDGNDLIMGAAGDDILYGGSGDDTLQGGAGEDFLFGQSGNDLVTYAASLAAITLDLTIPGLSTGDAAGDVLQSIERLQLTAFDDILRGSLMAENVQGGAGNDLMFGEGGNDLLMGNSGNDTLCGGAGTDTLDGGAGIDTASFATAQAAILLDMTGVGPSSDEARADVWISIEAVEGSGFNDKITLGGTIKVAAGGEGNDRLLGWFSNETLSGGAGSDTLLGNEGNDLLLGGDDGFGSFTDMLFGGTGNDTLIGGTMVTLFDGGEGRDSFIGNSSRDGVFYNEPGLVLNLRNPGAGLDAAQGDTFQGIEELHFLGGDVTVIGGSASMSFFAAFAGFHFQPGIGAETIAGVDRTTIDYGLTLSPVTLVAGSSGIVGTRGAAGDLIGIANRLILTSKADVFTQTTDSQRVQTLLAGEGNDRLTLLQSSALSVEAGGGKDRVLGLLDQGSVLLGTGDDFADLTTTGSGLSQVTVEGGDGEDVISIAGQGGTLTATGGAGNDHLTLDLGALSGQGLALGGAGNDVITLTGSSAVVEVLAGADNDAIIVDAMSLGALGVAGGDGNDTVEVTALAGQVSGGKGDDLVTATVVASGAGGLNVLLGEGNDVLTLSVEVPGSVLPGSHVTVLGDAGDDVILSTLDSTFATAFFDFGTGWGDDRITGYTLGADVIRFVGTAAGGLDDFTDLDISGGPDETIIAFGADSITLVGVNWMDVTAANIFFL
ncbi:beta strand repeat-containing protein [Stagnihabitans tardus]|uniref:Calcium-binding protein n=1 Tax=Stagnihabitans tardus TaxID=2699202 RepID=A0AAE4YD06_9RHOB|nr:calcium-binding protein [Stagnihabitans tardus]NBZ87700.1 hypothetical protein [Stagnihabitans tardus]